MNGLKPSLPEKPENPAAGRSLSAGEMWPLMWLVPCIGWTARLPSPIAGPADLPANSLELEGAEQEGIRFEYMLSPEEILGDRDVSGPYGSGL